jgi:hypothetical protein
MLGQTLAQRASPLPCFVQGRTQRACGPMRVEALAGLDPLVAGRDVGQQQFRAPRAFRMGKPCHNSSMGSSRTDLQC